MPKKHRNMPIPLQIFNLKRRFLSANAVLDDPHAEMDEIDWKAIDSTLRFSENLHLFEQNYPQYNWRIQKKEKSLRDEWQVREASGSKYLVYSTKVAIKPHKVKAKNKSYLHGRIQLTVDRKWIDRKAKIIVRIPHVPTLRKMRARNHVRRNNLFHKS